MIVRSAFPGPIIVFMKLLNIMDAKAARPITLAINFTKPARIAIRAITAGGMKTVTVGAPTATGMITTTIDTIANILPNNSHSLESDSRRSATNTAPLFSYAFFCAPFLHRLLQ